MILVTGGAGYIGSHVLKHLLKRGEEVVIVDNLERGHKWAVTGGILEVGDLRDVNFLEGVFDKYPINAVMHFAAFCYVGESTERPEIYYQNNIGGSLNLLSAMVSHNVQHMIFSSSCALYGVPHYVPIDENHPQAPISPYGRTKHIFEEILVDYQKRYGIKVVSFRYFNASGADPDGEIGELHNPETHIIPIVLDVALGRREKVYIFGTDYHTTDGTCIRDYIHVDDIAKAHIIGLDYLLAGGKSMPFNLGNGKGYSVKEVIKGVERVTGKKINWEPTDRRAGDPAILIANDSLARKVLGWEPMYKDLDEIIETAWNWHKKIEGLLNEE